MACSCCLRGWLPFSVSICTEHFIADICAYPRRIRWHGVLMLFAWLAAFSCVYLHRTLNS
jgi:hypothetical protein